LQILNTDTQYIAQMAVCKQLIFQVLTHAKYDEWRKAMHVERFSSVLNDCDPEPRIPSAKPIGLWLE
jgi:hypothetical protein